MKREIERERERERILSIVLNSTDIDTHLLTPSRVYRVRSTSASVGFVRIETAPRPSPLKKPTTPSLAAPAGSKAMMESQKVQ